MMNNVFVRFRLPHNPSYFSRGFKKQIVLYAFCIGAVAVCAGCVHQSQSLTPAPVVLPDIDRSMYSPGFWISRLEAPDAVIMTSDEIAQFNAAARQKRLITDITVWHKRLTKAWIVKELNGALSSIRKKTYYFADGKRPDRRFFDHLGDLMAIDTVPDAPQTGYGYIVRYANQRVLPTDTALLAERGDFDFDMVQNSAFNVGVPVQILHRARDGSWLYCRGEDSAGWIRADCVAETTVDAVRDDALKPFVITISARTDIFLDEQLTQPYDHVQMGTRLIFESERSSMVTVVQIPTRTADGTVSMVRAFVSGSDVSRCYLSYTPRTIIEQAFKMLNAPYGWGGMYGGQDCSRFIQEVFATVGVKMPRNSSAQVKVGQVVARFDNATSDTDKLDVLRSRAAGGLNVLGLKGHIMLFLGTIDGEPFVIHATWGYRTHENGHDVVNVLNKVVVSNLELGRGSKKRSLLERVTSVVMIVN